jgi:hypothetical protein
MSSRQLEITYWTATLAFGAPQAWSALRYLLDLPAMLPGVAALGYPLYFMKMLAAAKLLGIAAILYGRFPVLKEWAYAGFTFEVIAAILSLWNVGSPLYAAALPSALLAMQLLSYRSWTRIEHRSAVHAQGRRGGRVPVHTSPYATRGYY